MTSPLPLLLALTLLTACASSPPTPSAPSQPTAVMRLDWLSGRWHGKAGTTYFEETWSAPEGESMIGMFRAMKNGTAGFHELMTLERDGDAVIMRLLHFGPKLTPQESDGRALEYALVETDGVGQAIFETPGEDQVRRIVYRLQQGHTLDISLMDKEGAVVHRFTLSR
ncbi:DUF6265 family protein [Archangium lansingense]|uniref:DUF6265 family protein n=1 Tax=Archangium lansingense TaxID=2995310 RepID=A0ABT4ALB9_9BACT|nr:DUF6265 family protein [Archangium lansinium]MCY1082475.1 DUF6265 family protein [Archangium lansinium]